MIHHYREDRHVLPADVMSVRRALHNLKELWAVKLAPFILILDSMATSAPSKDPLGFGGGESGSFNTLFV